MAGPFEVSLVQPSDAAAVEAVDAFMDSCPAAVAQQTIAWRNVIAPLGPDEPLFLACRRSDEVTGVLPAYKFDGPLGSILTSAPQAGALGGVACDPTRPDREGIYQALLTAFVDLARERGCVLATVLTNPFWPDRDLCEAFIMPDFVLENTCQVLDLQSGVDQTGSLANSSMNVRRNLRKAQSAGLFVDEEQSASNVEQWYEIHAARHTEIGATPLPKAMFTGALHEMIPRDKARFFFIRLTEVPDRMVAGGFYVYHGQVIDALMPSMRSEFAGLSPNYLLALHTIRWAKARGLLYYNWQASPPGSGVYRFKQQWGSRDHTYYFFTRVTGAITSFSKSTICFVLQSYPFHYVMPFDKIGVDPRAVSKISSRQLAWAAKTGAQE